MTKVILLCLMIYAICSECGAYREHRHLEKQMKVVHSWKSLEFAFPNPRVRDDAIKKGRFKPGEIVPIDVDVFVKDGNRHVTFITVPRFQEGVPVTLGTVTGSFSPKGNPIIAPYPNWQWNTLDGNCNGLTSVFRVKVDSCKRLWVLDTGKILDKQVCPPQLLSFDLTTNKLIKKYKLPRDQYTEDSLFVTPITDIEQGLSGLQCHDTFVYIADVSSFALIVYDHRNSQSWKISNKLFYPYPQYGTFYINGDMFELMDGVLGLSLGPRKSNGDKTLFFHALSSATENSVPTSVIKNRTLFLHNPESAPEKFQVLTSSRHTQSAAEDIDKNGNMFFGLVGDSALACWNVNKFPNYGENIEIVVKNAETLPFTSGLKVVNSKTGSDQLWILSSAFQKFMTGKMNPHEVNFRIQAAFTDDLVRGTRCSSSFPGVNDGNNSIIFPS